MNTCIDRVRRHGVLMRTIHLLSMVANVLCLFYGVNTAINAQANTDILNSEPGNFEVIKDIRSDGVSTEEGILYPLDFVDEASYPIIPTLTESYYDKTNKCVLQPMGWSVFWGYVLGCFLFCTIYCACVILIRGRRIIFCIGNITLNGIGMYMMLFFLGII